MEKLIVRDFLVIKSADFEVGRINLIIGPQASGKSLIAKLLYFFRKLLDSTYLESAIKNFELEKDFENRAIIDFEAYFPRYTWANQPFSIRYEADDRSIDISPRKTESGRVVLQFDYSDNLVSLHEKLKNSYKQMQENPAGNVFKDLFGSDVPYQEFHDYVFDRFIGSNLNHSLFIPANRSFFATLQKNIFSLLASNMDIDPFIRAFGSQYEQARRLVDDERLIEGSGEAIRKQADSIIESILVGKYRYEDGQDWIESKGEKVNLSNASSGQQEALPMLLVMSIWSLIFLAEQDLTLFIEEPEAHLFPVSQKHVVSLFGLFYNRTKCDFVITTHSPYILTAFNNMILARDVAVQYGEDSLEGIMEPDFTIAYEDVRAYTIEDGVLVNRMNEDTRLIGENVIDSVSDEFGADFDALVNLQAGI